MGKQALSLSTSYLSCDPSSIPYAPFQSSNAIYHVLDLPCLVYPDICVSFVPGLWALLSTHCQEKFPIVFLVAEKKRHSYVISLRHQMYTWQASVHSKFGNLLCESTRLPLMPIEEVLRECQNLLCSLQFTPHRQAYKEFLLGGYLTSIELVLGVQPKIR